MGFSLSHCTRFIFRSLNCHKYELIAVHHDRPHCTSCLGLVRRHRCLPWITALLSNLFASSVRRGGFLFIGEEIAEVWASMLDIRHQVLLIWTHHPAVISQLAAPFFVRRGVIDMVHYLSLSHILRTYTTNATLFANRAHWRSFWRFAAADGYDYFLWAGSTLARSDRLTLDNVAEILHVIFHSIGKSVLKGGLTGLFSIDRYIA